MPLKTSAVKSWGFFLVAGAVIMFYKSRVVQSDSWLTNQIY